MAMQDYVCAKADDAGDDYNVEQDSPSLHNGTHSAAESKLI